MSKPFFDLNQFPLLTPKAFTLPVNKDDKAKENFLVGNGEPPGIYGKDTKLEYNYRQPKFETQFEQLVAAYKGLGKEIKELKSVYNDYYQREQGQVPRELLENFDKIIGWVIGDSQFAQIAESQRPAAFKLFKQLMEDILLYMRMALAQAQTTKNDTVLIQVRQRIAYTLSRLDEGFSHCSEQITDTLMSEQVQWTPATSLADYLLKMRESLVSKVAVENNPTQNVHRASSARAAAYRQGYGVNAAKHDDPYLSDEERAWRNWDAPGVLSRKFVAEYTYEKICEDIYNQQLSQYKALQDSAKQASLTPHQQASLRDKIRDLVRLGICREAELFETIAQANAMPIVRVNPNFLAQLPEFCARYTLLSLEQEGYVNDIGQLPYKNGSLDDRIAEYPQRVGNTVDKWCAASAGETILVEQLTQGNFFTLLNLLGKKAREVKERKNPKEQKDPDTFVFDPFQHNQEGVNLFDGVLVPKADAKDAKDAKSKSKSLSPEWRHIFLSKIIQHPKATCENLTAGRHGKDQLSTFNTITAHCSNEIFNLYWDRLIALYQAKDPILLAALLNAKDQRGRAAIVYALRSSELVKIMKLVTIPGLNLQDCLPFVASDAKEKETIVHLISCCNVLENKDFAKAHDHFTKFLKCSSSAGKQDLETYQQLLALLNSRYGKPQYPHHAEYQAFLQHLANHEKEVRYLLILKAGDPSIDLRQPRLLCLHSGQEVKDTALRVASKNGDDQTVSRLLDLDDAPDPDTEIDGENTWLLIANRGLGLVAKRQTTLLNILLDDAELRESKEAKWQRKVKFLFQLTDAKLTDVAFSYLLGKVKEEKTQEYYQTLGEDELDRTEFKLNKEQKVMDRSQHQVGLGKKAASQQHVEETHLAIAKRLGKTVNEIKDEKGRGVLYRVVTAHQLEKLINLLAETIELNFTEVFSLSEIQVEPQQAADTTDRTVVHHLINLIRVLQQKSADLGAAQLYFSAFYNAKNNPDYYATLLVMISNHCPRHAIAFFKQLAEKEQNVTCLQHLEKFVPINLPIAAQYAARASSSAQQFQDIWQPAMASLSGLSPSEAQLTLAATVKNLLENLEPQYAQQQRDKLLLVLRDFPIIHHLKEFSQSKQALNSPLDRLIHLLIALEQGQMDLAISYYLIDQQLALTENMTVAEPIARIVTQQWGIEFLHEFSRRLNRQMIRPSGFVKVHTLISEQKKVTENCEQAALLLLQPMQSGLLPSHDQLLDPIQIILSLHFVGKAKPWIFDESLNEFFQIVLDHCAADFPLQLSIIVFLASLDKQAAAKLFCECALTQMRDLLPEELMLKKLTALQHAMTQPPHAAQLFSEFLSYLLGQLELQDNFYDYDRLLTHFLPTLGKGQPFCQRREEKEIVTTSPLHFLLNTRHYKCLEQWLITDTGDGAFLAATPEENKVMGGTPLMRMIVIKDREPRQNLIKLWLNPEAKFRRAVQIEAVDRRNNTALMRAIKNDDEDTALLIWEYAQKTLGDNPAQLKEFANRTDSPQGKNAMRYAVDKNHSRLALRLLESVELDGLNLVTTGGPAIGFTLGNILKMVNSLGLPFRLSLITQSFFNCIEQDEKAPGLNTAQVIRLAHIVTKQCNKAPFYKDLFFNLFVFYAHSKEMVSALLDASRLTLAETLVMAVERGNVVLAQTLLALRPTVGADGEFLYHDMFYRLFTHSEVRQEQKQAFSVPTMACTVQHDFLDLFLSYGAHLDSKKTLAPGVKERVVKSSCFFTTFIKICDYDNNNELLSSADHKDLSQPKSAFLKLMQGLLQNPADKTQLYGLFQDLLRLIKNDFNVLPAVLTVLKKKTSSEQVNTFLTGYLAYASIPLTEPSAETQLLAIHAAQQRQDLSKDFFPLDYFMHDACNFATFLARLSSYKKDAKHYFNKLTLNPSTSELTLRKYCVFHILTQVSIDNRFLDYLALSIDDEKEFQGVLLSLEKMVDHGFTIDLSSLLSDETRLVQLHQRRPKHLRYLIEHFNTLAGGRTNNGDLICHMLVRCGCWGEAAHWLPSQIELQNRDEETPLSLALKTPVGDAKQRQAFFKQLAMLRKTKPVSIYETDLIRAARSPCDIECFIELLAVCPPEVINHRSGFGTTALGCAVSANQPQKVYALLTAQMVEDTKAISIIPVEAQLEALKKIDEYTQPQIIKIFWEHDKNHQLKKALFTYCDDRSSSLSAPLWKLMIEVYYLLHKDNALPLAEYYYTPRFCLGVIQRYGSYQQLFGDEKTCGRALKLLKHVESTTLFFAGISPLTYALQHIQQVPWLFPKLFPQTICTIAEVRLIYANTELRQQYLIPALGKLNFYGNGASIKIASLLAQFYEEEPAASASTALQTWVNTLLPSLMSNQSHYLLMNLLKILAKQFAKRDDVHSFLFLFDHVKESSQDVVDLTTRDTAVTFAANHGWVNLVKRLSLASDEPFAKKNDMDQSPLELALLGKDKSFAHELLDAKAISGLALWPVRQGTDSTLMLAVKLGDLAICQKIVERAQQECKQDFWAFLVYKNAAGKSALYLATELQQEEIVHWLLSLPRMDKDAHSMTTCRTAALCSYQQAQQVQAAQPAQPLTDHKKEVKAEEPVSAPAGDRGPIPKIAGEASAALAPHSAAASPADKILQLFAEQKLINLTTAPAEHQLADITQRLNQGQQDRGIQELLILLRQQGCGQLSHWLKQFPCHQNGTTETFITQLCMTALQQAATDPQYVPLCRDILMADQAMGGLRVGNLNQKLQGATILFSPAALDALYANPFFKLDLWPKAVIAYARACRGRLQHLESQLPFIQKILSKIVAFTHEETAQYDTNILSTVFTELTRAQRQWLITQQKTEGFDSLYGQVCKEHQAMLQQVIGRVDFVKVDWILNASKVGLDAKESALYLVDVNIPSNDAKAQALQLPPAFTLLEQAKQENVETKEAKDNAKATPAFTTLKRLIHHVTWQDTRMHKGQTLLMRAMTADNRIFSAILDRTDIATLCMQAVSRTQAVGFTALDLARPSPEPATLKEKAQWAKDEKNKHSNAESLAARLRQEFDGCIKQIRALTDNPSIESKDRHANPLNLPALRVQARSLALELLKFDVLQAQWLPKSSLVYSSFLSAISQSTLLRDVEQCRTALQSGQPLNNIELSDRAAKLQKFFIHQLVPLWNEVMPPAPASSQATAKGMPEKAPSSSTDRQSLLTFSKPLGLK